MVFDPIVLAITGVTVLPAATIALYVYESDPADRASATTVAGVTVAGAAVVSLAYVFNTPALEWFDSLHAVGVVAFFMLFVAPLEEGLKMAAVRLNPRGDAAFDTAMDGMVLGAFAGLGFASAENALYIVNHGFLGGAGVVETLVGRAGVAPAHVVWSSIAGYYLARSRLERDVLVAVKGVVLVALLHGGYNAGVHLMSEGTTATAGLTGQAKVFGFLFAFYAAIWLLLEHHVERGRGEVDGAEQTDVDPARQTAVGVRVVGDAEVT
ncbi:MAG: PrsW family intramembrane metalloprotease [Halobacteriales archaeon]